MLADPKDAQILRSGPRAWNAWRENNPSTVPDLISVVLTLNERQMGPINGGPINLRFARLEGALLRFATLSAADLEAAEMAEADLMHARFDQANLRAANLRNALLGHADFAGATLTKVNLSGASLQHAILSSADLEAADMSEADLMHARFDQANLSAANLTNARLDHADFAGANLSKANLCGASLQHAKNLTETQLKQSKGDGSTILPPYLHGAVSWSGVPSPTDRHDLGEQTRVPDEADFSPLAKRSTVCVGRRSSSRMTFTAGRLGHQVASWGRSLRIPPSGWWKTAMEGLLKREEATRFIGAIERMAAGWRASFRLRVPTQIFTQRGTEIFESELQATKWVHTQATARGFSNIEIRTRTNPSGIHRVSSWRVAGVALGVTLVISAFVWRDMNEAVPLDIAATKKGTHEGDASALLSPSASSRLPNLPAAAPIPDQQGPTEALAENTPKASAPVIRIPDLPAEAGPSPELSAPRAEQPAEAFAVRTLEEHLESSPPNYTALPPVTIAPPSLHVTALPDDAEIVPKPLRKPVIQKAAVEPALQKPVSRPSLPEGTPPIREANRNSQAATHPQSKPISDTGKKPQLQTDKTPKLSELRVHSAPTGPADVLAGGF